MWSYLRRFSRMTKEMRPSHRIDVLSDAIFFYAKKSISNLGKYQIGENFTCAYVYVLLDLCCFTLKGTTLVKRMKHAHQVKEKSKHSLDKLMEASPGVFV